MVVALLCTAAALIEEEDFADESEDDDDEEHPCKYKNTPNSTRRRPVVERATANIICHKIIVICQSTPYEK